MMGPMKDTHLTSEVSSGIGSARSAPPRQRPTWAEVDLDAIRHNVRVLRAHAADTPLLAAVKADGYGHGLVESATAALAGGATWLGVAMVEEGLALRDAGITERVLVFTEPPASAIETMLAARLTPAVYSPGFVRALAAAAARRGGPSVAVHCKLDTGMRRVGIPEAQWEESLRSLRQQRGLEIEGLWSHLAVADEPDHPFTVTQLDAFRRGLDVADALGITPRVRHLANSAGTLHHPETHFDLVRAGIAIYGLLPAPAVPTSVKLRRALSWRTTVTLTKRLAAGEAVSYGQHWSAPHQTTVASLPVGYADGVRRTLSNVGEVVVGGRRAGMVGAVCMDQMLIDLGPHQAGTGDEVCLIGRQGDAEVTVDDWAAWLGTITYEITCGIGARVPRVHLPMTPLTEEGP